MQGPREHRLNGHGPSGHGPSGHRHTLRPGGSRGPRSAVLLTCLALLVAPVTPAAATGTGGSAGVTAGAGEQELSDRISPPPHDLRTSGEATRVAGPVGVVVDDRTDPAALAETEALLRRAGATHLVRADDSGPAPETPLTVFVGGPDVNRGSTRALDELGVEGPEGLPAEGYVLASGPASGPASRRPTGRWHVILAGADPDGTYYAVQTLRQVLLERPGPDALPDVVVRDRPDLVRRGVIEGFYGTPWSHQDRLRQLDVAGDRKLNTYVYAPKDDPYHRERWREAYPSEELARFAELVAQARRNHVDVVFAVSPGNDVCHAGDADFADLVAKAGALHEVGVRSFAIFFDDIAAELRCAEDRKRFGDDPSPAAAAQAYLLDRFRDEFLRSRPGTAPLMTVPVEYSGLRSSAYTERFAALVPADVEVFWTGREVVSPEISDADVAGARDLYRHPVLLWDNYPVNDYQTDRLFLGPLTGRGDDLARNGARGLIANPMVQAEPSLLPLATVADKAWHLAGYDPERSWWRAIRRMGGGAATPLAAFADANRSSPLSATEAPLLAAAVAEFERALREGDPSRAAEPLLARFSALAAAPDAIKGRDGELAGAAFAEQAAPWLTKAGRYGEAGQAAVRTLTAERAGDATTAWRQRVLLDRAAAAASGIPQIVAPGVIDPFLTRARRASGVVTLAAPDPERTIEPGSDVTLAATVRSGDVGVRSVRFFAGPTLVGETREAPYEVTWRNAPRGLAKVVVEVTDETGAVVRSSPVDLTVGTPDRVLLVYGDDGNPGTDGLAPGEADLRERLEYLGLAVTPKPAQGITADDADGAALVLVSSTAASGDVGATFRDVAVPFMTWEAFVFDDMAMTSAQGELFRRRTVRFTEPATALSAGLAGPVDVYRQDGRIRWGVPGGDALVAATLPEDPGRATLFGYDAGAAMVSGSAPARRVGLYLGDEAVLDGLVTPETVRVFDNAVAWALGRQ